MSSSQLFKDLQSILLTRGDTVENALRELCTPSISISVLNNGEIISHCFSALGHDTETLFQACSISKPVAGTLAYRLSDAGKLDLDETLNNLLPPDVLESLARPETRHLLDRVTPKHLLSHTAGLSGSGFNGYNPADAPHPTRKEMIIGNSPVNNEPIRFVSLPGLEFIYAGGGLIVLEILIEHVTGMDFADLVKQEVLDPLGMTRSFYALSKNEKNFATCYWTGTTKCDPKYHDLPVRATAGLWTTPTDLLKLVRAIQKSLVSEDDDAGPFLRSETARNMLTLVKSPFGHSWCVNESLFGHGGSNNPGYRTNVWGSADLSWNKPWVGEQKPPQHTLQPEHKTPPRCGISIMTNSVWGEDQIWRISHAIEYLLKWSPEAEWDYSPQANIPFALPDHLIPQDISDPEVYNENLPSHWTGRWGSIKIAKNPDDPNGLIAGNDEGGMMKLRRAGIVAEICVDSPLENDTTQPSPRERQIKKSQDFLMDGLDIMLRFSWEWKSPREDFGQREGEWRRIVEMWNGRTDKRTILYHGILIP